MPGLKLVFHALPFLLCICMGETGAKADVVRLKNGGQIRGVIQSDDDGQIQFRTFAGSEIVIPTANVHFVTRRSEAEELFETRLKQTPSTADAHWELAEWCRLNRLKTERRSQAIATLLRDPNHSAARKFLGYIKPDEEWTTRDRQNWDRGYAKLNGRWVPRQTRDSIAKTPAQKELQSVWLTRMDRLANAVAAGDNSALSELAAVREPMALAGMTAYFREHDSIAARIAFVTALGKIKHPAMIPPLVEQAVFDTSAEVRLRAATSIPENRAKAATRLLANYLHSNNNDAVQNAAKAMGKVGYKGAIEPLIDALVTLHEYSTRVSASKEAELRAVDLLNKPNLSPREVFIVLQTGIVPAPGVEATTIESTGIQALYPHQNPAVLSALEELTGENFGFDQRTWWLWRGSK